MWGWFGLGRLGNVELSTKVAELFGFGEKKELRQELSLSDTKD
jgi:hypothetical protein